MAGRNAEAVGVRRWWQLLQRRARGKATAKPYAVEILLLNAEFRARRLDAFKQMLKERHTCALFSSPQDLAIKIGVDLIRLIDTEDDT